MSFKNNQRPGHNLKKNTVYIHKIFICLHSFQNINEKPAFVDSNYPWQGGPVYKKQYISPLYIPLYWSCMARGG